MEHNLKELEALHIGYSEETTFGNYTVNIIRDEDVETPREWDNLGTMVCWHSRYTLGDVDGQKEYSDQDNFWIELSGLEFEDPDYLTDEQRARVFKEAHRKNIILPLYLYDHSGITMRTSSFSCQWDSGQVGYIYVSLERVRKEYDCKRVSAKQRALVEKYLTGEVETYDQYLTGEVYGYTLTHDDDGEEEDLDSCWGFYGYGEQYLIDEIKSNIKFDINARPMQMELI